MLHATLAWAVRQDLLRVNPVQSMRRPRRPEPRLHLPDGEIAVLLRHVEHEVACAGARLVTEPGDLRVRQRLFVAEQNRLLVRLAADTGARRGELAVLRLEDLDGRVLWIRRNLSAEVLGSTKSGRTRRLTVGATTAAMITEGFDLWRQRLGPDAVVEGDWLFAPDPLRRTHARADALSSRFARVRDAAGVPDAALHRFRHSVATTLVEEGKLLKAQARLGHRDPSTTLRHYAHATSLDDLEVADEIDRRLNQAIE